MKKFLALILCICAAWIFFAYLHAQATPGTGILVVHVNNSATQQPIQGAKVKLWEVDFDGGRGPKVTSGKTDGGGIISFTLEQGFYYFRVKARGYEKSHEFLANVGAGATTHAYIDLVKK